jgi:hypothetical protein
MDENLNALSSRKGNLHLFTTPSSSEPQHISS